MKTPGSNLAVRHETGKIAGFVGTLVQDVRFGLRLLRQSPGFTVVVVVTLALGIGATTAIYSVMNAALLNPIPGPEPDRLVRIGQRIYDSRGDRPFSPSIGVTPPELEALRAHQDLFESFTWWVPIDLERRTEEAIDDVSGAIVSPSFFSFWNVGPILGRTFAGKEAAPVNAAGVPEADAVIVLSYSWWQSLFAGDTAVVGRVIELSGCHFTVIGVMPPDFQFPPVNYTKFWVAAEPPRLPAGWTPTPNMRVLVRLKAGISQRQTQAQLDTLAQQMRQDPAADRLIGRPWGPDERFGFSSSPLRDEFQDRHLQRAFLGLLAAMGFVLLIVCANIANLTLARTERRQQELAVRAALGCGRARLMRQLLTESMVLAGLAGLSGLAVTFWGTQLLASLVPDTLSRLRPMRLDSCALGSTLLLSLITGLAFGLAPAWHAGRAKLDETLKQAGSRATTGAGRSRYRNGLVIAEVALALVLLAGAGLMLESVVRLLQVKPGFDPENLVYVKVWLPVQKYEQDAIRNPSRGASANGLCNTLFTAIQEGFEALPGVKAVSAIRSLGSDDYQIPGQPAPVTLAQDACGVAGGGLFRTLRVPLLAGRYFEKNDQGGQAGRVIVNESLARLCWPGENALGKTFHRPPDAGDTRVCEVVGIVGDFRLDRYDESIRPTFYRPFDELVPAARNSVRAFVVRMQGDPQRFMPAMRKELKRIEPTMKAPMFTLAERNLRDSTQPQRTYMLYLVLLAAVGLLLAAAGIYGVLACSVAGRQREIGIRIAMGADRRHILGMVMLDGARLAALGVVFGLVAAFWLTQLLRSQLFEVNPRDPLVLAGVVLLLFAVALVACYFPARSATRIDPMSALRSE